MEIELRSVRESDYQRLFEWVNDRELRILSAAYRPISWDEHTKWIHRVLEDDSTELLIISEAQTTEAIGQILLSDISPLHRGCRFSIRIGSLAHRGQGVGTSAIQLMIEHAWRDLGLHRIELEVFSDNLVAQRAYEKCGFVIEGLRRQAAFVDGRWRDLQIMALLEPSNS